MWLVAGRTLTWKLFSAGLKCLHELIQVPFKTPKIPSKPFAVCCLDSASIHSIHKPLSSKNSRASWHGSRLIRVFQMSSFAATFSTYSSGILLELVTDGIYNPSWMFSVSLRRPSKGGAQEAS